MFKKIGGKWYKFHNRIAWYGDVDPPKCTGCDLMGMNSKCMVGSLPECSSNPRAFFKKHEGSLLS